MRSVASSSWRLTSLWHALFSPWPLRRFALFCEDPSVTVLAGLRGSLEGYARRSGEAEQHGGGGGGGFSVMDGHVMTVQQAVGCVKPGAAGDGGGGGEAGPPAPYV